MKHGVCSGTQLTDLDTSNPPPLLRDRNGSGRSILVSSLPCDEKPSPVTLHDEATQRSHSRTVLTPFSRHSEGSQTRLVDISSFVSSDICHNENSSPLPQEEPASSDHKLDCSQAMHMHPQDIPSSLVSKGRSSRHARNASLPSSPSRRPSVFLPQPTATAASEERTGASCPSSSQGSSVVLPPLPKIPSSWFKAKTPPPTSSYHEVSYPSSSPAGCAVSRSNTSTATCPSTSQSTSCPRRVFSRSKIKVSLQSLPHSTSGQREKIATFDDRSKSGVYRQEMTDRARDPVSYLTSRPPTTRRSESRETQQSRGPSPSPSADSEAAERWLTEGTQLRLFPLPQEPWEYSSITTSPPACEEQLGLRLNPETSTSRHPNTDITANPRTIETTQQYIPKGNRSPFHRSTSPSRGGVKPSSRTNTPVPSGTSSLGRASGGILRAKKSLKNLFQKSSPDAAVQCVSRPVLVPQPRPDNDVPPMPARIAFNRPKGSPPQRPERCGSNAELLDLGSLELTRVGFTGLARNEENMQSEKAEKGKEVELRRRTSRYVVEQNGEVRIPHEHGAAPYTVRRGMLIKDVVTDAVEFVADI